MSIPVNRIETEHLAFVRCSQNKEQPAADLQVGADLEGKAF
jgi:hypothetical protein